ncbi:hypothetical protein A2U01_0076922, partial [Trifolium medium]|nr:hypothetical protein [Trifolium medium]
MGMAHHVGSLDRVSGKGVSPQRLGVRDSLSSSTPTEGLRHLAENGRHERITQNSCCAKRTKSCPPVEKTSV